MISYLYDLFIYFFVNLLCFYRWTFDIDLSFKYGYFDFYFVCVYIFWKGEIYILKYVNK